MIRSRKCSRPIAPTITRPTSRCAPPSSAPAPSGLPAGCRYRASSARATSATVGAARIGASGQGRGDQVVADDLGQAGPHLVDQFGIDTVGHHPDQRAAAVAQRRDPRRDRVEHLLDGPPARADDQQHRRAEVVRGVDVEVELDGQRPGRVVAALDDHDVRGDDLGGGGGRGVGHRGRGDAVADHRRTRAGVAVGDRRGRRSARVRAAGCSRCGRWRRAGRRGSARRSARTPGAAGSGRARARDRRRARRAGPVSGRKKPSRPARRDRISVRPRTTADLPVPGSSAVT